MQRNATLALVTSAAFALAFSALAQETIDAAATTPDPAPVLAPVEQGNSKADVKMTARRAAVMGRAREARTDWRVLARIDKYIAGRRAPDDADRRDAHRGAVGAAGRAGLVQGHAGQDGGDGALGGRAEEIEGAAFGHVVLPADQGRGQFVGVDRAVTGDQEPESGQQRG